MISIRMSSTARRGRGQLRHRGHHRSREQRHRSRDRQQQLQQRHGSRPSSKVTKSSDSKDDGRAESLGIRDRSRTEANTETSRFRSQTANARREISEPSRQQPQTLMAREDRRRHQHRHRNGHPDEDSRSQTDATAESATDSQSSSRRKTSKHELTETVKENSGKQTLPLSRDRSRSRQRSSKKGKKQKSDKKSTKQSFFYGMFKNFPSRIMSALMPTDSDQKQDPRNTKTDSDTQSRPSANQNAKDASAKMTRAKNHPQSALSANEQSNKDLSNSRRNSKRGRGRGPERKRQSEARRYRERLSGAERMRERLHDTGRERERQDGARRDREREDNTERDKDHQEDTKRERKRDRDEERGRDRKLHDDRERDRKRHDDRERDRKGQDDRNRDRSRTQDKKHQDKTARDQVSQEDAGNPDRRRQEDTKRGRKSNENSEDDTRRDSGRQDGIGSDRQRRKDTKRDRERKREREDGTGHSRKRQGDMEHDSKSQDDRESDRKRYDDTVRDTKREKSVQDNTERDRRRQHAARRGRGRHQEAKRHRERQESEGSDKGRQTSTRPNRRRQGEARRGSGRQADRSRVRQPHTGVGRVRGFRRQDGRRRDRGRRLDEWRLRGPYSAAGRKFYDFPSRPAAADRLERRLNPSLTSSARTLLRSMERVVSTLSSGLGAVRVDNSFVFNGTRYTIMLGVRQQLQVIAKANDMVYDTVLRTSLLTKDIYLRAHQNRLTGPTTRSLSRPEVSLPSLYTVIRAAYDEERQATQALRSAQELQRQRDQLNARFHQVRERFQDNFARNDIRTLVYYINSTSQKLSSELSYSTQAAFVKRNVEILHGSRDNLREARDLLYKAGEGLATGAVHYRGNYAVVQDWKRFKHGPNDGHAGAPSPLRRRTRSSRYLHRDQPTRELTARERARLRPIIDQLKRHAREQERLAMEIERLLRPAIIRGRSITQKQDIAASARLSALASQLQRDGKKLYTLLDSIRVLIGAEEELRWTGVSRVCREDDDDTEGSGCVEEGSGEFVLEGGEEGEGLPPDDDFTFTDEKEPSRGRSAPTSLTKFGRQLSVYVDGVKLRSNDILQRGDKLYDTTEALSQRWSAIKKSYDVSVQAHRTWKETQETMRNVTQSVDEIHDLSAFFSEEVTRSHDSIQTRMKRAVEIAERRLAEAQARKTGGDSEKPAADQPVNDEAVVLEAVDKVQKVRKEIDVIKSLRVVAPQSCGRASVQVMRLHSNISHLRQQVNTAKALLQSMQLSITKAGGGYLSIPLSQKTSSPSALRSPSGLPPAVSMVTTVEVCVKTQDTDGPVLLVKGNNSATFSLYVDDRQLSVTMYDAKGYDLETVTSDVTMAEDKWYNVRVTRIGTRVLLRVKPRDGTEEPVENDVTVSSMKYLQPDPLHVYVGGVADSEPFSVGSDSWRGCLGELHVNGKAVSLLYTSSTGEAPRLCTSQCAPSSDGYSWVFDGIGFLHFPASVLPMRRRMQSVHFLFRSRQGTAALLHLVNKRQRFMLRVMLADGAVIIDTTTPSESIVLRSRTNNYNDGLFHSLTIQYRDSTTYPEIDGIDDGFTIERSRPHSLNNMADGVVVGAFVTGSHVFEKSKYRPLIGCLQEVQIDDRPLEMSQALMSTGVVSGICDPHTVWSQCVQFDIDSTGIDLGPLDRSATIVLLFSPETRGPLLTYTREGKFEAEVAATDDGLLVTTEEKELEIVRPDDVTDPFVRLIVTDDGKVVKYSAWGEEDEMSYAGFWSAQSDVDGVHNVQLGLPLDPTSDTQLFGQLSQVIVGDRFIDLTNYTLPNNLEDCQRPLPDLVTSETVPEMTSTEDSEGTCSKDIRC